MITNELVDYIKKELSLGTSYDALRTKIIKTGWEPEDFNEAMRALHPEPLKVQEPVMKPAAPMQPVQPPIAAPVVARPITPHIEPIRIEPKTPISMPVAPASPIAAPSGLYQSTQTQTQPQFQPQSIAQYTPAPEIFQTHTSPKRKILLIIIIVIGLFLIAGAVYGYVGGYFQSLTTVTTKAFEASHEAKTASFQMTATVDTSGVQTEGEQTAIPGLSKIFTLTMQGASDGTNPDDLKFDNIVSFDAGSINGELDMRRVSGMLYGNLTKAPSIGFVSLAPFQNKWFSFPSATANDPTVSSMLPAGTVDPSAFNSLTKAQQDHIYEMAQNAHFITITKRLSPEKINGVLAYHFVFDLDREGMKSYIENVGGYIRSSNSANPALASFDPESFAMALDQVKDFNGEAWIGVWDHLPYKLSAHFGIAEKGNESAGQIKVSITTLFSDWNKPVVITAPSDSVPFQTFVSSILQQMGMSPEAANSVATSQVSPIDGQKEAALANMRAQAALFYDSNHNSYTSVCTSSRGLLPIAKSLPAGSDYKCKSNSSAWVSSVNIDAGGYYCVDSIGAAGNMAKAPTGFSCGK